MARVSQIFKLNRSQGELDFVDVDIGGDLEVFVDPVALRTTPTAFANESVALLQDFFQEVLLAIRDGDDMRATDLMSALGEPNETHLGMSKGASRGRGMGEKRATKIWEALVESEAARSGLLHDLEDTALMIEGIGPDLVSDLCTNVIRSPLLRYTEDTAVRYGIPLSSDVDSGRYWDITKRNWNNRFCKLPMPNGERLLLVPKHIVRRKPEFNQGDYYNNYILPYLQSVHLQSGSDLVETLRGGKRRVTKRALKARYGAHKSNIVDITKSYPQVLDEYRKRKRSSAGEPPSHLDLGSEIDLAARMDDLRIANNPSLVVRALEGIAFPTFYPSLSSSEPAASSSSENSQYRCLNQARGGFFRWLRTLVLGPHVLLAFSESPESDYVEQLSTLVRLMETERISACVAVYNSPSITADVRSLCRELYRARVLLVVPVGVDDLKELVASSPLQNFSRLQDIADGVVSESPSSVSGSAHPAPQPAFLTPAKTEQVVLFVTALALETKAVRAFLKAPGNRTIQRRPCTAGRLELDGKTWEAVILECGAGNVRTAIETGAVAESLNPDVAIFVGVAGGRKDVALGDVVVASKVYRYEGLKEEAGAIKPRSESFPGSARLERHARIILANGSGTTWAELCAVDISPSRGVLAGLVGPIASGEKVVADATGPSAALLAASYSDVVAVEMEGVGFMEAIHRTTACDATVVRGISDLLTGKEESDAGGWQPIAATRAAAIATLLVLTADEALS